MTVPFTEKLMQYVWQHRLWPPLRLVTVQGDIVDVIDQGLLNTGPGPDFFNAKVRIGRTVWVGAVEIHRSASDWFRHGHDTDPAYDSVILHVVDRDDCPVPRRLDGNPLPQLRLPCSPDLYKSYQQLVDTADRSLPCSDYIRRIEPLHLNSWVDALGVERMQERAAQIESLMTRTAGDRDQATYAILARALGFGANADPMERLAGAAPLSILRKHADSLTSIEAILFGQAGMLQGLNPQGDPYIEQLKSEYNFMAAKFNLSPLQSPGWRMGTRPQSFPQRRIATLAALLAGARPLTSEMIAVERIEDVTRLFTVALSPYWQRRYTFTPQPSVENPIAALSRNAMQLLTINAVVPVMVAYGRSYGDDNAATRAIELLENIPAEHNRLVDIFMQSGIKLTSAFVSQALLRLRRSYCLQRKCLYCRIGHRMLSASALRP